MTFTLIASGPHTHGRIIVRDASPADFITAMFAALDLYRSAGMSLTVVADGRALNRHTFDGQRWVRVPVRATDREIVATGVTS